VRRFHTPVSSVSIDGGKIAWKLTASHEFRPYQDWDKEDDEEEPWGTSEDGIVYTDIPEGRSSYMTVDGTLVNYSPPSWLETELALTSPLPSCETPPGVQVHTIQSVSRKIVWQSGDVQEREPLNLLPGCQVFRSHRVPRTTWRSPSPPTCE
jgi:hypothetical protein